MTVRFDLCLLVVFTTFFLSPEVAGETITNDTSVKSEFSAASIKQTKEALVDPESDIQEFEIRGTVTYIDAARDMYFVVDNTAGILVRNPISNESDTCDISVGSQVLISGVRSRTTAFQLVGLKCNVLQSSTSSTRSAIRSAAELEGELTGAHDGAWISLTAQISESMRGMASMSWAAKCGAQDLIIHLPDTLNTNHDSNDLVQTTVRLTGNVSQTFNDKQTDCWHMFVPNPAQIVVADRTTSSEMPPEKVGINHLLAVTLPNSSEFLIHGQITAPPTDDGFYLQDQSTGIKVLSKHSFRLKAGNYVRVSGKIENRDGRRILLARDTERLSLDFESNAIPLTATEISQQRPFGRLVETEGRLLEISADRSFLVLEDEDQKFKVAIGANELIGALGLAHAKRLRVQGVCDVGSADRYDFTVHSTGSVDAVHVIQRHWFVKPIQWIILSTIIGSLLLLSVFWATTLKRKVAQRTRDLQMQKEHLQLSRTALTGMMARLRSLNEALPEAVIMTDAKGQILEMNGMVANFFGDTFSDGHEEISFSPSKNECFADPAEFKKQWQSFLNKPEVSGELEFQIVRPKARSLRGYTAPVRDELGRAFGRLWIFHDLTQTKQLESRLLQAQKMEAVGRLVGGIAHDFNNLLAGISGSLALAKIDRTASGERYLNAAENATERAIELIKQLLGFSRSSPMQLTVCDTNGLLRKWVEMLRHTIDASIKIDLELDETIWPVKLDPTHLDQVVLNMCVNARDAMQNGGTITVSTENVYTASKNGNSNKQHFVAIRIRDTGKGIPDALQSKIFEPFFTTKPPGEGTGLGLAMSYGIVRQMNGWIDCHSKVGHGTEFSIFLPRSTEAMAKVTPVDKPLPVPEKASRQNCHVLLVDDEVLVRNTVEGLLQHAGYRVTSAKDGSDAIEKVDQNADVDVVLLDFTMPGLSGKDVLHAIRLKKPNLPVIVCSGYVVDLEEFTSKHNVDFLAKPFNIKKMVESIETILRGDSVAA